MRLRAHPVAAELHQQADVGGRGEAARGKGDHGQPAGGAHLLAEERGKRWKARGKGGTQKGDNT